MLQVGFIKQHTELVKQRLAVRNFKQPELVDELLKWDEKRRQYQLEQEEIQAKINASSKEIGQLMARGEKEKAASIKQEVAESKAAVEVATGGIDTAAIERERTAKKIKAAGILQQFEAEMGISAPPTATSTSAPSVGGRVGEKSGS